MAAKKRKTTVFSPDQLAPDLDARRNPTLSSTHYYWVGLLPKAPVTNVSLAGINFPIANQKLVDDPSSPGNKARIPVVGAILELNEHQILKLQDRLSRTVIRFTEARSVLDDGIGEDIGDELPVRKGFLITIPTEADQKALRERGKAVRDYVAHPNDEPIRDYVYAVPCSSIDEARRKASLGDYPQPLSETGLEWPDEVISSREALK